MADCGVYISSVNLSGLTTEVTFFPQTGGTAVDLGNQNFPFSYVADYYYGTYNCYVPTYAYSYTIVVPEPTPTETLTPTVTPSPTETPSETPTNTPTPSTSPSPVISYGFNLVVLPYTFPSSGNTIIDDVSILAASTNPNLMTTEGNGIYFNPIDVDGIDRTSYFSSFTGQSITLTMSQGDITVIYSGNSGSFKSVPEEISIEPGFAFGFELFGSSGTTVLVQSATTDWVTGQTVYISAVINEVEVTPTPTPTNTPTETPTNTPTVTPTQPLKSFSVFFGVTSNEACENGLPATLFAINPIYNENNQFYDDPSGEVFFDMSGFYNYEQIVVELLSDGTVNGSYNSCE